MQKNKNRYRNYMRIYIQMAFIQLTSLPTSRKMKRQIKNVRIAFQSQYPETNIIFNINFYADDFYNKPWGLKHWLDNSQPPIADEVVVALIDPDMIFVRPLTTQIRGLEGTVVDISHSTILINLLSIFTLKEYCTISGRLTRNSPMDCSRRLARVSP